MKIHTRMIRVSLATLSVDILSSTISLEGTFAKTFIDISFAKRREVNYL
jgi:hypothetical protein